MFLKVFDGLFLFWWVFGSHTCSLGLTNQVSGMAGVSPGSPSGTLHRTALLSTNLLMNLCTNTVMPSSALDLLCLFPLYFHFLPLGKSAPSCYSSAAQTSSSLSCVSPPHPPHPSSFQLQPGSFGIYKHHGSLHSSGNFFVMPLQKHLRVIWSWTQQVLALLCQKTTSGSQT